MLEMTTWWLKNVIFKIDIFEPIGRGLGNLLC